MICNHPVICICTNKIYLYGKMLVSCYNLNVFVLINKRYEEHAVFLYLILLGFLSAIACIVYFCHSNIKFLLLFTIDVRGSVKLIQAKKFIVLLPLGRIEARSNGMKGGKLFKESFLNFLIESSIELNGIHIRNPKS